MTPRCTVCSHKDIDAIDAALVAGTPVRDIAGQHRSLSKSALDRHRADHLPAVLKQARAVAEAGRADQLLTKLDSLETVARAALEQALRDGVKRDRDARGWHRELRQTIELLARVAGDLRTDVQINVTNEWQHVSVAVLNALEPFPDARVAVVRALEEAHGS